ncbi:MAG TPA: peptide ABC transporter ATP-binding protein [Coprothermobacter sp.]|jgi:peptide/nickel transport system ATP-binding protein/oligopeptide transport system ATP-binding protein|nr:peptide ABC transporter ATP-binding protein [Coprothermobacter sp.]
MEKGNILEIKNLQVTFYTEDGIVHALQGVSYEVPDNETLGVVGESGCGKSVTALTVMRLLPKPQARVESGEIWFKDKETGQEINILEQSEEHMRHIRGNKISMIFQEPMTALNPVYTVGDQIMEAVMVHNPGISNKEARERAIEMLKVVGIPAPEKRVDDYPHQMSGGMRQRVMIAMALSTNPEILIADEPTTALDVTIQAQILDLMNRLQEQFGMSIILITHNLGVVAQNADRIAVMYLGRIVEKAAVRDIFHNPKHPYTEGLLASVPRLDKGGQKEHLPGIMGNLPSPYNPPPGCKFHPRCPYVFDRCRVEEPPEVEVSPGHIVCCWLHTKEETKHE